jgi:Spy/CpxP family protein refolding chaperone
MTFLKNTHVKYASLLFGSAALVALVSATSVAPAHAQGVPAGLLRLDPAQPSHDSVQLTELQRAKVRSAYARARRTHAN